MGIILHLQERRKGKVERNYMNLERKMGRRCMGIKRKPGLVRGVGMRIGEYEGRGREVEVLYGEEIATLWKRTDEEYGESTRKNTRAMRIG
jgi:hypothetical protein